MFNKDFIWGVATASAQIEGGREDGKKDSIWDLFTHTPNHIADNSNCDIACDSYHRIDEDIKLIKELGVKSYRFSISWSRVIPDGVGSVNEKGIKFYVDLVDKLIALGIEPMVTLYHWDMPLALMNKGGFLNKNVSYWFEYYTEVITKAFNNKVKYYCTINEPQVILHLGYKEGIHAPGLKCTDKEMLQCVHNLLLCHGRSVSVIRKNVKDAKITFAPCSTPAIPVSNKEGLYEACKEENFRMSKEYYANLITIYSDPIMLGDYPKEYYEMFNKEDYPEITKEDLALISQPIDFLCQNIYSGRFYDLDDNGNIYQVPYYRGFPQGDLSWDKLVPESLYYGPKYLYERYKKPIVISENGITLPSWKSLDGKVHDPGRIDQIARYVKCLEDAAKEVPILGYYHWSLLDNFEWACGYVNRFGLVFVDYNTLERTPKDSYYFYKEVIKNNGVK